MAPQIIIPIITFISGGSIMVLELIGTRILSSFLGLSLIVWTNIIAVILAALSFGYFMGGKLADKKPALAILQRIITFAGVNILLMVFYKDLVSAAASLLDPRIGSFLASIILFGPPSFLLAMVTPYVIKLELHNLQATGRTAGNLYAISTAGSIVGTFLTGFLLIPNLNIGTIMLGLGGVLILSSLILDIRRWRSIFLAGLIIILANYFNDAMAKATTIITIPSAYAQLTVVDQKIGGEQVRLLLKDSELQSGIYLKKDELLFDYIKYFQLDSAFVPQPKRALLLGGGAYVIAQDFLKRFPAAAIDVVEIDPKVTMVAKRYFGLNNDPRLRTTHQDGRLYLNSSLEKYDIIYNDTFASFYAIPYQLTTREAIGQMYRNLNDNGIIVVNLVSSLNGQASQFFASEYATFQSVFPRVFAFAVKTTDDKELVQNIVLIASKDKNAVIHTAELKEPLRTYAEQAVSPPTQYRAILTDEFAPTDYYMSKLVKFLILQ